MLTFKSEGGGSWALAVYTPATKASMVDCTSEETDTSFI